MIAEPVPASFHSVQIASFPLIGPADMVSLLSGIFAAHMRYRFPHLHLLHVPQAHLVGPHLFCLDQQRRPVASSLRSHASIRRSPFVNFFDDLATWDEEAVTSTRIDEEVTVVGGKASSAFFHWMIEIVPRLVHLCRTGEAALRPIVMRPLRFDYQRASLDALGLSPVFVRQDVIDVAGAYFPTHMITPHGNGQISPEAIANLRAFADRFPAVRSSKRRRLYISRADARKRRIRNEAEVAAAMAAAGFEICQLSTMSLGDQVRAFRSAEIVVGQHGAGLTLTAVCEPGTKVVELYPDQFTAVSPFWTIASLAGLDYRMMLCPGEPDRRGEYHNGDLVVDAAQAVAVALSETCEVSGHLTEAGLLERCEVTGKRALPSELERCAVTSTRAVKILMVSSSVSRQRILESIALRSVDGRYCSPAEAGTCTWSGRKSHPDDLLACRLTGVVAHSTYLTDRAVPCLKPLVEMLDGASRPADRMDLWNAASSRIGAQTSGGKGKIEAAVVSPTGTLLAVCCEVRTMLGMRVRHIGTILDGATGDLIAPLAKGRRQGSKWKREIGAPRA